MINGCYNLICDIIFLLIFVITSMQVPPQLNYNQLQTKAFFSVFKQWPIQPISNGGQYWPGQVVRFFFNALTDGVMDPYRSHIQITVSTDIQSLPVGLLQVDNSAQSFIQQILISSKNRQIQRIVQYGVLAAYFNDQGISQLYSEGKQTQGLGYSNIDNYQSIYTSSLSSSTFGSYTDWQYNQTKTYGSNGGVFPTIPLKYNNANTWGIYGQSTGLMSGAIRGHVNWVNTAWLSQQTDIWYWYKYIAGDLNQPACNDPVRVTQQIAFGYNNNIRAQYLAASRSNDYIQTTSSTAKYQLNLESSVFNNSFPAKFTNQTVYQVYTPQDIPYFWNDDTGVNDQVAYLMPNLPGLHGFTTLYSPHYAKGVRQPFISPTVPQCQMMNGVITQTKFPISRRTFKIPLISSCLGLLIPQKQFVLLPLRALNDLLIEMTIDNYAMFTSGYNDISQFDNVGMGLMQQRAFKVERLVYNLHTYQFWNPQMDQYLKVSLTTGIAINTKFWQLGNQYQIQNSQSITNSWPVACNQQALNQILVLFVPLDYQNFTFCRKHFRISNNISKLQLRINMQYFPSQPLSGNAGNPVQVDSDGNNSVFLEQIYMSGGYFFEKNKAHPKINSFNFAINERCYNILNTHTMYDPAMIDDKAYQWGADSVNSDTAMGFANVHENRYVGKAAYLFSFQPYAHSKDFLTGIDTRAAKAFDVIFTCIPQNWFPRPQTMYIYTGSSVIMEYSSNGIVNINK